MKTLQEEWKQYRDAVYPDGIPARQNLECQQAFFAGALIMLHKLSELPEDAADQELNKLLVEAAAMAAYRCQTLKEQN